MAFSPLVDPYGLIASGLPPELASQLGGLNQQQQVAQALMQQSMGTLQAPESKGRFQGRISPLEGVAKLVQAYLGQKGLGDVNAGMADLASKRQQMTNDAMSAYQNIREGTPGRQAVDSGMPYTDTMGAEMPQGNISTPAIPGRAGDPRAAVSAALLNPLIAHNAVVAADLKKMEPNWQVHEQFDQSGKKVKVLVNLNDPTQTAPFGGSERTKLEKVTVAGPGGSPATSFVDPYTQTAPIPEPVKQEIVDTGKVRVGVNPYQKDQVLLGKTTTPGEDQSRATSLAIHGLGADGLPTGDIQEVAKAIAEGRMAPLSSFAMSSPRGQMIMSEVSKANPNYDVKDFHAADQAVKAFASGKQGNTVRSFNVALSHLDTLDNLNNALGNGDVQMINKAANAVSTQLGGPAPVNFEAAKKIVGDEIVKAIVGSGGGVGDREKAAQTISAANSPAQLKGVISTYKNLMQGQLGGLRQQYEQSTGRKDFDRFLSEKGRRTSDQSATLKFDAQGNQTQ